MFGRDCPGKLNVPAAQTTGRGRRDSVAYALYANALHVPIVSLEGARQRIALLTQAVKRDPSFADAAARAERLRARGGRAQHSHDDDI